MKLEKLQVKGFRPFHQNIEIDFERITILIGNNDSGKSSILDILEIVLTANRKPDENDYYTSATNASASEIIVTLSFRLTKSNEEALPYALNNTITIRAKYTRENSIKEYLTELPIHENLRVDFSKLSAAEQKEIIQEYDPDSLETTSNSTNRTEWFLSFVETIEKVQDWKELPVDLLKILPKIQRFGAMDYESPENLINRTVKQVFETVLFKEMVDGEEGVRELKQTLKDIASEAEEKINTKVSELKEYIQKYAPTIANISYEPQIDFTRGFQSGDFKVNEGRGDHYLNKSGDGTKRKVFMATTDWDRDVTLEIQAEGGSLPDIIRAYDEPDTNLDFHAQRQLYKSISDISNSDNSNIQSIICTHSPRLIDRAPAISIRMLAEINGGIVVDKIETYDDKDIEEFLSCVARDLGITNSLMFYESCFIFVEGDTECNALPLFYRSIYGHCMLEDGINIINVKGKSSFKEFLKLFSNNRKELAIFFMDQDCADTNDDQMTEQILHENGFDDDFCNERMMLVGQQEFEDLFSPEVYTRVYNKKWSKKHGDWSVGDFTGIDSEKKYSNELKRIMFESCDESGDKWSKPELGKALGRECRNEEIPQPVKDLFLLARQIAKAL